VDRIPDAQLLARLAEVRRIMATEEVDRLVVFGAPRRTSGGGTVHYLTGWTPLGSPTILLVGLDGPVRILADGPNVARVLRKRAELLGETQTVMGGAPAFARAVHESLASMPAGGGRLAVAGGAQMPLVLHEAIAAATRAPVALDRQLEALRLIRTAEEVAMHARAAAISDAMINRVMELAARAETTPAALMAAAEHEGRRLGADFSGLWLATGERPPTTYFELFELDPELGPHDRIQLGTTLSYEGHFGQSLRMGIRGRPSQAIRDCASRLVDMQEEVLSLMRPGVPMHQIVDRLEALIDADCPYERLSDPFRFQSCHALGVDYSEPAYATALSPARDRSSDGDGPLLAEHMVFEIHPNFTLPELGHVCAGDMAVITASGAKWLTGTPRGLVELGG
jgi:Xaa-Pro aminopeptidase